MSYNAKVHQSKTGAVHLLYNGRVVVLTLDQVLLLSMNSLSNEIDMDMVLRHHILEIGLKGGETTVRVKENQFEFKIDSINGIIYYYETGDVYTQKEQIGYDGRIVDNDLHYTDFIGNEVCIIGFNKNSEIDLASKVSENEN